MSGWFWEKKESAWRSDAGEAKQTLYHSHHTTVNVYEFESTPSQLEGVCAEVWSKEDHVIIQQTETCFNGADSAAHNHARPL